MIENDCIEWEIIERSFNDSLTEEEREILGKWLTESQEHRDFYYKAKSVYRSCETEVIIDNDLNSTVFSRADFLQSLKTRGKRRGFTRKILYAAALLPPIIALALFIVHQTHSNNLASIAPGTSRAMLVVDGTKHIKLGDSVQTITTASLTIKGSNNLVTVSENGETPSAPKINSLIVPRGGEFSIVLPDGTRIFLNSESVLEFPDKFTGNIREVTLRGEAYFDVAKNPAKPFIVKTTSFNVKVTGTSFNINSYEDCSYSNIAVESGKVEVTTIKGEVNSLGVGQMLNFDRKSGSSYVQFADPEAYTAWKDGLFYFDKEPLESILKKISRWYNIDLELTDSTKNDLRFVGKITKYDNAGRVLEMLESTEYINFKYDGDKITVY